MTTNNATHIHASIRASRHSDLLHDFETAAIAYAHWRTRWGLASSEERLAMDEPRAAAHNALIDACNILARAMVRAGEDASWRSELGDDRREIGDFACHLHCLLGLRAR